ncbi:MAG TPA: 50S ribosomal protein L9 [Planctomycetota bacterium]|nr:50S ribosomal protein L9 [Planctomycetota bacterium]
MQLLLKQDVRDLGKRGDVVEVSTGYGRNFLVPRGIAVAVNPENVRLLDVERRRFEAVEAERRASLKEVAQALAKTSVTIQARANEEGHLFGSVGAAEIAAALKEEGFDTASVVVLLEKPIKELGVFDVEIRLDPDISSVVKVWVVGE